MKISELQALGKAPEWLVLADTKDADVEVNWAGKVVWNGGEFLGGEFLGGYFLGGYFLGGEFRGGEFLGGYFLGGYFRGGYFLGGVMIPNCKWVYGFQADGRIKLGCKVKTIEEWDAWFASDEVYTTPRGTDAFKRIEACYKVAKLYAELVGSTFETT